MDKAKGTGREPQDFLFVGNQLWLDFLNTKIKQNDEWLDLLGNFADFVRWLAEARVLDKPQMEGVLRRWPNPSEQQAIAEQARSFREVLRLAVESVMRREAISEQVVDSINAILRHHCRTLQLSFEGDKLVSRYVGEMTQPLNLLAPIAESAAQTLSGESLVLTRKCENPACALHFHDTTKNHTRRWCSMETCGNREKAAAYYKRAHSKVTEQPI